jgi:hypothetical protein
MSDSNTAGYAQGINSNLGALVQVMRTAFPLSASQGQFTCAAAGSTVVSNTSVKATSLIIIVPANAAAATLQGSSKSLYVDHTVIVPGVSFTAKTASSTAVGTEIFKYLLINVG